MSIVRTPNLCLRCPFFRGGGMPEDRLRLLQNNPVQVTDKTTTKR